jgi:hypothetical protein
LKNLKCEQIVVRRALKNLPKTLDETYERIFLSIPQEQWIFVQHMFRWMVYFVEERSTPPWTLSVEAARTSAAEFDVNVNDIHYDIPAIQELCGCLISFGHQSEGRVLPDIPSPPAADGIYFAHYTVREYLASKRIADSPVAHFAICSDQLHEGIWRSMFLHLLALPADNADVVHFGPLGPCGLEDDFTVFCVKVVGKMLHNPPSRLLSNGTLFNLSVSLLDMSKPHFAAFCNLREAHVYGHGILEYENFWALHWIHPPTRVEASIFLNQLLTSANGRGTFELAERYLRNTDKKVLFQTNLDLRARSKIDTTFFLFNRKFPKLIRFNGTVVEFIAQVPDFRFQGQLEMLLKHGEGLYDCSKGLLSAVVSHLNHCGHDVHAVPRSGFCPLKYLIEGGADPNGMGYHTRPLQITVHQQDYGGTKVLLEAGANPNHSGDPNGVAWEEGMILAEFNGLHNTRPLLICQNQSDNRGFRDHEVRDRIRLLLLSHGADELSMRHVGHP